LVSNLNWLDLLYNMQIYLRGLRRRMVISRQALWVMWRECWVCTRHRFLGTKERRFWMRPWSSLASILGMPSTKVKAVTWFWKKWIMHWSFHSITESKGWKQGGILNLMLKEQTQIDCCLKQQNLISMLCSQHCKMISNKCQGQFELENQQLFFH